MTCQNDIFDLTAKLKTKQNAITYSCSEKHSDLRDCETSPAHRCNFLFFFFLRVVYLSIDGIEIFI